MAITAAMVKELREMTGAGMMDCKKALTETNGDMDAAVDVLMLLLLIFTVAEESVLLSLQTVHLMMLQKRLLQTLLCRLLQ